MFWSAFYTQIGADAFRCLAIAGVAVAMGWAMGTRLPRQLRWWGWLLLAAPLFTPALLVSYTYAPGALWLTGMPSLLTTAYSALVCLKLVPLGALAGHLFPPPTTPEAIFCAQLIARRTVWERLAFVLRASGPSPWMTMAIAFLLAFTDFELASLLSIKTWTVMLFDAHAGGLALAESLKRISLPLVIELLAVVPLIFTIRRSVAANEVVRLAPGGSSRWPLVVAGMIATALTGWPLVRIMAQSIPGWKIIGMRETLGEDILMSLATAVSATGVLWLAFGLCHRRGARLALALPGLLGSLVLALLFLTAIHASPPSFAATPLFVERWRRAFALFAETPAPLILCEALLLAPAALALRTMLAVRRPAEALHLARMAGSRRLVWDLSLQPAAAALALLFVLAYFEFTAATILAPIHLTPAFARLHNLAHYGQTSALSAMLLAATLAPSALLALTLGGARLYARRDAR